MESGGSPRVQDVDRLTDLYQTYLKLVWRSLRAAGVRAADLDDVTHDVFLVVRRNLDSATIARLDALAPLIAPLGTKPSRSVAVRACIFTGLDALESLLAKPEGAP
jgi:hypothetical protein